MKPTTRQILIQQLRHALGQLESPVNDCVEFDVLETDFCVERLDEPNNMGWEEDG